MNGRSTSEDVADFDNKLTSEKNNEMILVWKWLTIVAPDSDVEYLSSWSCAAAEEEEEAVNYHLHKELDNSGTSLKGHL